ncbi:MAG: arsenosugar biosynthesis radical SAM protein ArsS [Dehalobacter sp.]|nr:arsenosugar biosynthesis radical SAM protein ArsS [Dehalobacter sp.]
MESYYKSADLIPNCLQSVKGIKPFKEKLKEVNLYPLRSSNSINTLQVNVGKVCNLSCKHCHAEAGPHRRESMSQQTMSFCLQALADNHIPNLDITGGAPELNSHLSWFLNEAVKIGSHVMIRTNLTVLALAEYAPLLQLFASKGVEIISSLPCYKEENTERQRGKGVFQTSIQVLQRLNNLGYGNENSQLKLNLVYNPGGAFLPPPQHMIEVDFRRELLNRYGVRFNNLHTLTNVPVGRFLTFLTESQNLERYMSHLAGAFNLSAVSKVMCRELISVGWDGQLYDCDFNQMLGLNCQPRFVQDFNLATLQDRKIMLNNHCYACTAGVGSSCGGALA